MKKTLSILLGVIGLLAVLVTFIADILPVWFAVLGPIVLIVYLAIVSSSE